MGQRKDPREMNGGYQLSMFDTAPESDIVPDPAPAGSFGQSPIGDRSPAAATTAVDTPGHRADQESGRG